MFDSDNNRFCLSGNPSITMKDVLARPDKPWSWGWVSRNPNMTMRDVLAHPDRPWDWGQLSENRFLHHPVLQSNAIRKLVFAINNTSGIIAGIVGRARALHDNPSSRNIHP